MNEAASLARQNARLLAVAFILLELVVAGALIVFMMLPMARRSADDLAALMTLSAQTWTELPPQTRKDFELELFTHHALALRADLPGTEKDEWHPPYFYFLEEALAERTGTHQHLVQENIGGTLWYWTSLPVGDGQLAVGVPQQRISTQPTLALLIALLGGLGLAFGVAIWLADRITVPLARLTQAARRVGQGENPQLLPETGPRELVDLARCFNEMAQQVQGLLSARTILLAGVSHDLRTPLARMRLALEMLRTNPDPGLITRLESDIEQMNQLIGKVLDLARGLEREEAVSIDIQTLLNELAAEFDAAKSLIKVDCPSRQLKIPPFALRGAIGNLLQNAIKYAPGKPIDLICIIEETCCRVGVLDRGPGIPPDQIEAMFQPFHRLDPSRSPVTGGAGLGLSITRELGRANKWEISLQARQGGGLEAWITMPYSAQA